MYPTLTCLDRRYERGEHRDGDVTSSWEFPQAPLPPPLSLESFEYTRDDALQCVCLLCFNAVTWVALNCTSSVRIIFHTALYPRPLHYKLGVFFFFKDLFGTPVFFFESD